MLLLAFVLALQAPPSTQDPAAQQVPRDIDRRFEFKRPVEETTTSRTATLLSRSAATVSVISGEDLQTLGVRSLSDALRIIPGLEVGKISATETSVSVRSYTAPAAASQGIMALVDGRQVYNEFFGGVFWEALPVTLDEIKSIEVIRGPGSFLYGPNAMHGLVNIITKSPLDYAEGTTAGHELFLSAAAGSYASNVESFTVVRREGDTALKGTVAHDDIEQFSSGKDTRNKYFVDLRLRTKLADQMELELSGGGSRQKFDVLFPPIFLGPLQLPTAAYVTQTEEYFLKANYFLSDALKVQLSWTHFNSEGDPGAVYQPFTVVLDTADIDAQFSFTPFAGHRLTLGTGHRFAQFDTHDEDVSGGRHATNVTWVFVQDEWQIAKEWFLTGGARLDAHSEAGRSLAPRLALVWEFDPPKELKEGDRVVPVPGQSFRATAGYGFRNPSLRDLWFDMTLQPAGRVVGNKELDPEVMKSFELGYWGRLLDRLQAEGSIYYNRGDRLVAFGANTSPPGTASRHNVNSEEAYGIELNVEYQLTREIYSFANYAYEVRRDRDTHDRNTGGPLHKANAGLRLIHEGGLSGMLWINFFDRIEFLDKSTGNSLGSVPSYTLLNMKVWHPFRLGNAEGKVFLQGFNLLDNVHREHPQGDEYGLLGLAGVEIAW
jgi:iron complex outermembrane receptor protein